MRIRAGPLLAVAALACAQPGSPPGGEPDQTPPRVLAVEPSAFDTLTELDARVVIRFDERISERLEGVQRWSDAVIVAPATSPVQADRRGRRLEIELVDDWEPDRVYRVTVLPVYRDLFGNVRERRIELVFSTGAPFPDGALAGFATDRITGQPVADARVRATRRIDGTPYPTRTDTAGFFALTYLPAGSYEVVSWRDDNFDRVIDFFEIRDSVDVSLGVGDTAVTELALLPSDTTPARLARAEPLDSITVELLFDDYFAPGPVDGIARVFLLPDTVPGPASELVHPVVLDSIRAARTDTAAPDTLPPEPAPGREADPAHAGRDTPAEPALPLQELMLVTASPLLPDTAYVVRIEDVTNIQGVPGGGGTAAFVTPTPPPPDTATADTAAAGPVPSDSASGDRTLPDTLVTPPDTVPQPGPARGPARGKTVPNAERR